MLRTDFIDLINERQAWAFVGSGVSIESGYPSWERLVDNTLVTVSEGLRGKITSDGRFKDAIRKRRYEKCLGLIEEHVGRDFLDSSITRQLSLSLAPGEMALSIADWPFVGYATTNYDPLLEDVVQKFPGGAWISVGNVGDEITKVAGDPTDVIWHVHGFIGMGADRSRLILTDRDYDDIYLEGSPLERQLRGLLTQRRVVFIGFGFNDPELKRLLRVVKRYTNPARPAIAFLGCEEEDDAEARRTSLREEYNVDVIPYRIVDGAHVGLAELLKVYSSFILGRSLTFGQPRRHCPSYEPETAGLLVYNRLVLSEQAVVETDAVGALVRARILALLRYQGATTIQELTSDLVERTRLVTGTAGSLDSAAQEIARGIKALQDEKLINVVDGAFGAAARLTREGSAFTDDQAGTAARLNDQFRASLFVRALDAAADDDKEVAERVSAAAEAFLKDCATRRALGVAMVWESPTADFQHYHMVALLQALPKYAEQLTGVDEGRLLVDVIKGVLAKPTENEATFLGVLIQAQFGLNLMGFDPDTVAARTRDLSKTAFVVDSTTLIPYMGRSSTGFEAARQLITQMRSVGATPVTTDLLAVEVAEHARWALKELGASRNITSLEALSAATGRRSGGDNVFLDGCLSEASLGKLVDFDQYLDSICANAQGHSAKDRVFQQAIDREGIPCKAFDDWDNFDPKLFNERDEIQEQIAERRRGNRTYRHDRQVRAEAEALILVREIRAGEFALDGARYQDAYFVSQTRLIDDIARPTRPITMRPQAVQQWLSTLTACAPDELKFIVNGILWELSERGLSVIDTARIRTVFGPLIDASQRQLEDELAQHRNLISDRYGENGIDAFQQANPTDTPFIVESYFAARSRELEQLLAKANETTRRVAATAALSAKDQIELDELRAIRAAREARTKEKRRKAAAGKGRRKRKRN